MSRFFLLLAALTASGALTAQAQTQIGSVTLSRPGQVAQPAAPRAAQDSMSMSSVPAGWTEVRGRISGAGGAVKLPSGSRVNVSVRDLSAPAQVMQISFATPRLSTPYQVMLGSGRLNAGHRYALVATVTGADGKVLYTSAPTALPQGKNVQVNLMVK